MAEYKMLVTFKEVYCVFVEADDDEAAEELALQKVRDGDESVECVTDTLEVVIDGVYD